MENSGRYLKGAVVGALVGVAIGVLIAPKSGKETREDLKIQAAKYSRISEEKLRALYLYLDEKSKETKAQVKELKGVAKDQMLELSQSAEIIKAKIAEALVEIEEGKADAKKAKEAEKEARALVDQLKKLFQ